MTPRTRDPKLTAAAKALGVLGGRSTSEAKAAAARENGKRGGRPKKMNTAGMSTVRNSVCLTIELSPGDDTGVTAYSPTLRLYGTGGSVGDAILDLLGAAHDLLASLRGTPTHLLDDSATSLLARLSALAPMMGEPDPQAEAARRAADPDYHECCCRWDRDNAGAEVLVSDGTSTWAEIKGPARDCGICDNTGWCT